MGVFADTHTAGNMPLSATGLKLSQKGVLVTAYKKSENGKPALLRIWEQAGKGGECTITLPAGTKYTQPSHAICATNPRANHWQ